MQLYDRNAMAFNNWAAYQEYGSQSYSLLWVRFHYSQTFRPNCRSSNQGFFCMGCPKLFPLPPPPPAPQVSAAPGLRRRRATKPQFLTKRKLMKLREERRRMNRALSGGDVSGVRVRGRWVATRGYSPLFLFRIDVDPRKKI